MYLISLPSLHGILFWVDKTVAAQLASSYTVGTRGARDPTERPTPTPFQGTIRPNKSSSHRVLATHAGSRL